MIRSTLFKSVAPALRDSLNDAEVVALGTWLLMSAGAYLRGVAMFAKDGVGTEELEAVATAKYVYPEGTHQEELMTGGMTNPDYRLPTANRMTAANVIAGLEDLMYTIAASNEERDNPHRNAEAPPMPQPIPNGAAEWRAHPFVERTPEQRPTPNVAAQWQAREFNGRAIPPPPQANRIVARDANIPRFTIDPDQARVFPEDAARAEQDALATQAGAAAEEHAREMLDWMQRNREAAQAHVDALANRTRGIPNRR